MLEWLYPENGAGGADLTRISSHELLPALFHPGDATSLEFKLQLVGEHAKAWTPTAATAAHEPRLLPPGFEVRALLHCYRKGADGLGAGVERATLPVLRCNLPRSSINRLWNGIENTPDRVDAASVLSGQWPDRTGW